MRKTASTFLEKCSLEEIQGMLYLKVPLAVIRTMTASSDQFTPLITSAQLELSRSAWGGLSLMLKNFSPDGSSGILEYQIGTGA